MLLKTGRNILVFLLLPALLMQCTKDRATAIINPPPFGCSETDSFLVAFNDSLYFFPPPPPVGWQLLFTRRYQYYYPSFSPTNPYQFVYIRQEMERSVYTCQVRVFDICTGVDKLISSNAYLGTKPKWSSKGWIVYTGDDGDLWKVKDNGTNLTKLTFGPNFNYEAIWNPEGTLILFKQRTSNSTYTMISNSEGFIQDTIPEFVGALNWSWGQNNRVSTPTPNPQGGYGIGFFDINSISYHHIKPIDISGSNGYWNTNCPLIHSTQWIKSGSEIIYGSICFISITDTANMQTRVIRQGAQNAVFDYMSVSADEQKIAIARTDQSLSDSTGTNGLLNCAYNIYIMNRDGSDLRRVAFPE
ncbi:MAG: translocation protein TolB [Bacteroidota bacterium]|jgi:hypothetical protein